MRSKGWSVVLGGVAVALLAAMVPLSVFAQLLGEGIVALVIGVPCMAVGFVVARRQPRNPLGWLFLVIAIFLFVPTVGGDYAYLNYQLGHSLPFAAAGLAVDGLWSEGLALFIVAILLFPDGRLPSRFWRWALRVWCAAFAVLLTASVVATAGALAAHPIRIDTSGGLVALDNPVGWFAAVNHGCLVVLLTLSVAFIGRQVLSWRRSSGERRQQLKWLASGAAVSIVSLVLAAIFASSSGSQATVGQWIGNLAWFGLAALPVSIGVAILRYRLYDIDRIISRTLAYALVTGLLIGVFAGLVLLTTDVLSLSSPVGRGRRLDAGGGGAVQPAAAAGPAGRGPPVQPDAVQRGPHGRRVRRRPQGRHGRDRGPRGPDQRRAADAGARAHLPVDQPARVNLRHPALNLRHPAP